MTRIIAVAIGLFYAVVAFLSFQQSAAGWAGGNSDLGFWWGVIAVLLTIAGTAAVVGTFIHTRPRAH